MTTENVSFGVGTTSFSWGYVEVNGCYGYQGANNNDVRINYNGSLSGWMRIGDPTGSYNQVSYSGVTIVATGRSCCTTSCGFDGTITYPTQGGTLNSIVLNPCPTAVQVGYSTTLSAACMDSTGAGMTCPALTWAGGNQYLTVPSVTSSSNTITGVAAGSASVTTSASGIISNACTVNVTTTPPPPPSGCSNCDLAQNICVGTNCIRKTYVYATLAGLVLLILMK